MNNLVSLLVFADEKAPHPDKDRQDDGAEVAYEAATLLCLSEVLIDFINDLSQVKGIGHQLNSGAITVTVSQPLKDGREVGVVLRNADLAAGSWRSVEIATAGIPEVLQRALQERLNACLH